MAACQWKGGKCKSVQQAKAFLRHNDKDRRKDAQHTNPHIDKTKTHLNFSYRGLTYKQRCGVLDARLANTEIGRISSGKNARTIMQSVIVYPPEVISRDPVQCRSWMMDAGRVIEAYFGENFIDMAVDMDEEHEYYDKNGQKQISRNHGHAWLFPEVDGKLNGKAFSSRANIAILNNALDDMSIELYGVPMMDGTKKKGGKTVEELKAESEKRAIEIEAEAKAKGDEIIRKAKSEAARITGNAYLEAGQIKGDAQKAAQKAIEASKTAFEAKLGKLYSEAETMLQRAVKAFSEAPEDLSRKAWLETIPKSDKTGTMEDVYQSWHQKQVAGRQRAAQGKIGMSRKQSEAAVLSAGTEIEKQKHDDVQYY